MKHVIIKLLCLALAFPPTFWANVAHAIIADRANQQLASRLTASAQLAGSLRQVINRSAFDTDALLDELAYDADGIIAFVRDEIAFEPYAGLLRGPKGTLMSQAGNSLDQAVLLAKLLRDAGYDARVARGTLSADDSRLLLRQMARPRPAAMAVGDLADGLGVLRQAGILAGLDPAHVPQLATAISKSPVMANMPEFAAFNSTLEALQEHYQALAEPLREDAIEPLLEEASDYFWVETRPAPSSDWQPVHPALPDGMLVSPERREALHDTVPVELQHRLRLQMFIEQRLGGKKKEVAITSAWESPAANLSGQPVVFAALPDTAINPSQVGLAPEDVLDGASFFTPFINGAKAPGAKHFDLAGNVIDPMVAGNVQGGIFREIGRAFGDAAGDLGGDPDAQRLESVWVNITLVAPGGEETSYRRILTGAWPDAAAGEAAAADDALSAYLPLLRSNTLVVANGRTPRGMAVDGQLQQWQQDIPGFKALAWGLEDNPTLSGDDKEAVRNVPGHWPGHLGMLTRFDQVEDWSAGHRLYRHQPFVGIHTGGVGDSANTAMSRVDIVHNARRSFDISGQQPVPDPAGLLAAGTWETLTEGSMLVPGGQQTGAADILAQAKTEGIALKTLRPGDSTDGIDIDARALPNLEAELARGYAVLVPERRPQGLEHTAWWRVHPSTGETLGQMDDGRGIEVTEYQMMLIIGIAGLGFLHYSLYGCFSQAYGSRDPNTDITLVCCVTFNYGAMLAMTLLGAGLALKLTDLSVDMVGLSVDVLDFGMGFDGMVCDAIIN